MLTTGRQRFKMISVRNTLAALLPLIMLLMLLPHCSSFGFDSANSCTPNGGAQSKQSRRGRAQIVATIPCDLTQQAYCHLPGSAYPWHAVRRFVHENQGLMKRMYGDVKHISVLRDEILGNEIDVEDVAMAAERYSRDGNRRTAKVMRNTRRGVGGGGGMDEEYMGAGRPTNDVLKEPHFRPMTTSSTTETSTTTDGGSSSTPQTTPTTKAEAAVNEAAYEKHQANQEDDDDDDDEVGEDLAANSVYELIPPTQDGRVDISGDNIQIIASPQLSVSNATGTPTSTATTLKEVATTTTTNTTTTELASSTSTTTTTTKDNSTTTLKSSTTTPRTTPKYATPTPSSSSAFPFRRRQRPSMLYKQHYQQQPSQQQSQMLHLKISSTILRDSSTGTRTKFNESERIAVKGVGGLIPPPPSSQTTTTSTTTTSATYNKRKPIKNETTTTTAASSSTITSGGALKGDRFRKPPTAPTTNGNGFAQSTTTPSVSVAAAAATTSSTAAAIAAAMATKPVLREGQLYQDTLKPLKQEPAASPAMIPVTANMRGVNACPVKEEVVAPFWANNTRGEVLALLNLYPFEQYVHWEKCTHEHKQMYCRDGCRCEQQYRLHRLLAYDPHNECRGIFSDWFRFPSCCICKCYNVPMEFRATSRSPRADQSGLHDHDHGAVVDDGARAAPHPIETAEAEVKRAIYEHATEDWYRPVRDEDEVDDDDEFMMGDEFGELF